MLEVFRTLSLTSLDVTIETPKRKWGKKKRRMLSGSGGSIGMGTGAVDHALPRWCGMFRDSGFTSMRWSRGSEFAGHGKRLTQ
jgi:hypothetical protein